MDASQNLSYLSLPLCLFGSDLFCFSKSSRCRRHVMRLIFMIGSIGVTSWLGSMSPSISLSLLSAAAFTCGHIFSNICLMCRRKRLERLIRLLASRTLPSDLAWLKRVVIIVSLPLTSVALVFAVMSIIRNISRAVSTLEVIHYVISEVADWIPFQVIFYWTVVRLLHGYRIRLLQQSIEMTSGKCMYQRLIHTCHLIRCAAMEADQLLSPLPFLWFSYGIVAFPASLIRIMSGIRIWGRVLYLFLYNILPLMMVYETSRLHEQFADAIDAIIDQTARKPFPHMSSAEKRLTDLANMRLSAMSFFVLDKAFIISYLNAVLTFAALAATYLKANPV